MAAPPDDALPVHSDGTAEPPRLEEDAAQPIRAKRSRTASATAASWSLHSYYHSTSLRGASEAAPEAEAGRSRRVRTASATTASHSLATFRANERPQRPPVDCNASATLEAANPPQVLKDIRRRSSRPHVRPVAHLTGLHGRSVPLTVQDLKDLRCGPPCPPPLLFSHTHNPPQGR